MQNINEKSLKTASALFCEGFKIEDIALILSIDIRDVYKLIEHAESSNLFEYKPALTNKVLDPEISELIYNESLTESLKGVLKNKIELQTSSISITPSPPGMFSEYDINADLGRDKTRYDSYRQAELNSIGIVSQRASRELQELLFDGKDHVLGLNWGTVVKEIINHINPIPSQLYHANIQIVSLFGDMAFYRQNEQSPQETARAMAINCNNLVTTLARRLGGKAEAVLLNVPGFIPALHAQDDKMFKAIKDFMTSHLSYQKIFGGAPPDDPQKPRSISGITTRSSDSKIRQIDTIITGIGSIDNYTWMHEYLSHWLDEKETGTLLKYNEEGKIAGDIGGHFVATLEEQSNTELNNFLKKINRRILAAQPSDFIDVASRFRKEKSGAGVVGITTGARKARILYTLLSWETCPINRIIIDTHCALALLNLIDSLEFKRFIKQEGSHFIKKRGEWSSGTRMFIPPG